MGGTQLTQDLIKLWYVILQCNDTLCSLENILIYISYFKCETGILFEPHQCLFLCYEIDNNRL